MPTYAIGDIQGCYQTFIKLLNKIDFNTSSDQLWLAGDLINRGADSLKVLNFVYQNRKSIKVVLGNHDLHFLAAEAGATLCRPKDTLDDIFQAENRKKLVKWLTKQPLFYRNKSLKFAMSHAGLYPKWSISQAKSLAEEVSMQLQTDPLSFYFAMYGDTPDSWNENLQGLERLRFITNALTRMRFCDKNAKLDLKVKSPPGTQPKSLIPWFELPRKKSRYHFVFGHWASLNGQTSKDHIYALDTGCVWGGTLTALRLEDKQLFSLNSVEK